MIKLVFDREIRVYDRPRSRLTQQFRQPMITLRPHHEIDRALLAQDFGAFRLSDTSSDGDPCLQADCAAGFLQKPDLWFL